MTLTLTPQTEALLMAKAKREGEDMNTLADTLLADLLAHDEANPTEEPAAAADEGAMSAEMMSAKMRAAAKMLADYAREAEPETEKVLLFPSAKEIRLLYVDPTALPTPEDEAIAPFYFGPNRQSGISYWSAVTLIRPEEEGHIALPAGWGDWKGAEEI